MRRTVLGKQMAIAALATVLGGCAASVRETPVKGELPPMPQPQYAVGYKEMSRLNGKEAVTSVVSETADSRNWSSSNGCSATTLKAGFGPTLAWRGCGAWGVTADGQQTASLQGDIWPLAVGRRWSYSYEGTDSAGNRWNGVRSCQVEGAVRIQTTLGEHDTFKVSCTDPGTARTYFVSPGLKTTIYYEDFRRRDGWRNVNELTKIE